MVKKFRAREGDWFVVPLRTGGYALGLVARVASRGGILFGYFFGPKLQAVPDTAPSEQIRTEPVLLARFGDRLLAQGRWPYLGRQAAWLRSSWPMPSFVRRDAVTGQTVKVSYSDTDPGEMLEECWSPPEAVEGLPSDGLWGAEAVEVRLTRLLAD